MCRLVFDEKALDMGLEQVGEDYGPYKCFSVWPFLHSHCYLDKLVIPPLSSKWNRIPGSQLGDVGSSPARGNLAVV